MDPGNDTTEEPSRIKTSGYHQSPLNVLMNPDERQSPNFSESEMNKRRLNYWVSTIKFLIFFHHMTSPTYHVHFIFRESSKSWKGMETWENLRGDLQPPK